MALPTKTTKGPRSTLRYLHRVNNIREIKARIIWNRYRPKAVIPTDLFIAPQQHQSSPLYRTNNNTSQALPVPEIVITPPDSPPAYIAEKHTKHRHNASILTIRSLRFKCPCPTCREYSSMPRHLRQKQDNLLLPPPPQYTCWDRLDIEQAFSDHWDKRLSEIGLSKETIRELKRGNPEFWWRHRQRRRLIACRNTRKQAKEDRRREKKPWIAVREKRAQRFEERMDLWSEDIVESTVRFLLTGEGDVDDELERRSNHLNKPP